jgi:hypothetical protein
MTTPMFKQIIDTKPIQIPQFKQIIDTKPIQIPQFKPIQISNMKVPLMPAFGLGGGFDSLGRKGGFSGQWYMKKHKVKSASQMLQTFGVIKIDKALHKIDKASEKSFTAFRATKGKSGISEFKVIGKAMHFYPSKKRRTKR